MSDQLSIQGILLDRTIAEMLARELDLLIKLLDASYSKEDEPISKVLTALHRFKGSTGFIGFKVIENLGRELEKKIKETSSLEVEGAEEFLLQIKSLHKEIHDASC